MNHQPNTPASLNEAVAGLLPSSEGARITASEARVLNEALWRFATQTKKTEARQLIAALAAPGAAIDAREQEADAGELQPMALKICSMLTDEISRLYPFTGKASHGLAKAEEVRTNISAVRDVAQELNRKLLASRKEAPAEQEAGYANAFYELGELMGIPAQPISPERVWREQMLPTLQKALAVRIASRSEAPAASAQVSAELNGAVASLQAAVIFTDQMRAAAAAGEAVTATGVARDAREWLERAARALIDALSKPATPSEAPSPATVAQPAGERPDYIRCIAHDHAELKNKSWCGRDVGMEFHFQGVDHAAENGRQEGRLVACTACVSAIAAALKNGAQPCASQGCGGAVSEDDPYYNLLGVIANAKAGNFNAVCVETLERVAAALSNAPRSLDGATPGGCDPQ